MSFTLALILFLAACAVANVILILILRAPWGWQSDDGFHHGKPGEGE